MVSNVFFFRLVARQFPGFPQQLDWSIQVKTCQKQKIAKKGQRGQGFSASSQFHQQINFAVQAAELYEVATAEGLQPAEEPLWTAQYE